MNAPNDVEMKFYYNGYFTESLIYFVFWDKEEILKLLNLVSLNVFEEFFKKWLN